MPNRNTQEHFFDLAPSSNAWSSVHHETLVGRRRCSIFGEEQSGGDGRSGGDQENKTLQLKPDLRATVGDLARVSLATPDPMSRCRRRIGFHLRRALNQGRVRRSVRPWMRTPEFH